MSIRERAKIELEAINFGEEDTKVMLRILDLFFDQWDSGGAVSIISPILTRLISGQPLKPLTGEDSEWWDPQLPTEGPYAMLQNLRCSSVFKSNGRCWDIDNDAWDGTFPYDPATKHPADPVIEIEI